MGLVVVFEGIRTVGSVVLFEGDTDVGVSCGVTTQYRCSLCIVCSIDLGYCS